MEVMRNVNPIFDHVSNHARGLSIGNVDVNEVTQPCGMNAEDDDTNSTLEAPYSH